jgi:hypothetical protein
MTLIAVLILFPTPSLHAWGPDDAIPGGRDGSRAVAVHMGAPRLSASPGDPSGIGECAEGEWGDDDGVTPLVDLPSVPRRCRRGSPASRRCRSPMIDSPSLRSRHLRC